MSQWHIWIHLHAKDTELIDTERSDPTPPQKDKKTRLGIVLRRVHKQSLDRKIHTHAQLFCTLTELKAKTKEPTIIF